MQLKRHPRNHLTYCTNIHPGETWNEVFDQLKSNIPALKSRISPSDPFGVGLRLSAEAANQLLDENRLQTFKDWLQRNELYVFTINGFPYGSFHRQRVKDLVYTPDWRTPQRVDYTLNLVTILTKLLPEGLDGGISTSPLSYKYWLNDNGTLTEQVFFQGSKHLARIAYRMHIIKQEQGKELHLDIEPEPDCLLENTRETIDFFKNQLLPVGCAFLSRNFGYSLADASDVLRNHIRVCYDTCHFAVEYENPRESIKLFNDAGIKIGKTQISAALKVKLKIPGKRKIIANRLRDFEESTYLHQVIERRSDGSFYSYRDLSSALPYIYNADAEEWRIHYHVPIFIDKFEGIGSTQNEIKKSLDLLINDDNCHHFEIETYTWEVLPEELKINLQNSIEREFQWVADYISS